MMQHFNDRAVLAEANANGAQNAERLHVQQRLLGALACEPGRYQVVKNIGFTASDLDPSLRPLLAIIAAGPARVIAAIKGTDLSPAAQQLKLLRAVREPLDPATLIDLAQWLMTNPTHSANDKAPRTSTNGAGADLPANETDLGVRRDHDVAPHQDHDVTDRQTKERGGGKASAYTNGGDIDHSQPSAANPVPAWKQGSFTAAQLQEMRFAPTSFLLRDIIPAAGVTLLCSKPKFGKSWLIYDICIGCTTDRLVLGDITPAQGDVLYLALEDSKKRLHNRMNKLLPPGSPWPERLTLKTEWRRLHEGGLEDIRAWFHYTKTKGGKPVAVAIDVLAKVRKPAGKQQLYEADYEALGDLTKLANEIGIAIVVVHHTRKMAADDLMETVSGSYGVSGSVDTILVMAKTASGAVLDVRGRDVESSEFAIEFNKLACRWSIRGMAIEVHVSDQRGKVLAALKDAPEGLGIAEIKVAAQLPSRNAADILLYKMAKAGEVERVRRGVYALPSAVMPETEEDRKD